MAPASANQKSHDTKHKKHASRASNPPQPESESPVEANGDEPAYLKELNKSLRNAAKKLNATSKIDAILAENQGKSLDDLVEEKKINADQKAQALKKPALQAQVAQIEEQIGHYKEVTAQYEERLASQKAALEKAHQAELEAVRANVVADATESSTKALREQLLSVTKFLCAAANLRRDGDAESPESRAFEGVLFQVYGGNQDAVTAMTKLINGADDKVVGVEGETLEFTYGDVKQSSNKFAPTEETAETTTETAPASDPTLANAGLTELGDTSVSAVAAGQDTSNETDQLAPPSQTLASDGANPVAQASFDSGATSASTEGWVEVPRDPAETDTGLQATPANVDADVKNNETGAKGGGRGRGGRGRGRDGYRGRGRGDYRGRGEFRGRGRGGRGRGHGGANGTPAATPE